MKAALAPTVRAVAAAAAGFAIGEVFKGLAPVAQRTFHALTFHVDWQVPRLTSSVLRFASNQCAAVSSSLPRVPQ